MIHYDETANVSVLDLRVGNLVQYVSGTAIVTSKVQIDLDSFEVGMRYFRREDLLQVPGSFRFLSTGDDAAYRAAYYWALGQYGVDPEVAKEFALEWSALTLDAGWEYEEFTDEVRLHGGYMMWRGLPSRP